MIRWSAASILVAVAAVLSAAQTGVLEQLELWAYDRLGAVVREDLGEDRRIVLVTIDEPAIAALGWPLGDETVSELVARVLAGGARAVGLDVYRDQPRPPGTVRLDELLAASPKVVGVTFLADGVIDRVPPPAALVGTGRIGFADLPVDRDSVVRRGLLFRDDGAAVATGLALRVAMIHLAADGIVPRPDPADSERLQLGAATYRPLEPDDGGYARVDARGYQFLLDYGRRMSRPAVVSAAALLENADLANGFRDRTVLIGVVAPSTKDFFPMPAGAQYALGRRSIYGVELQAAVTAQILRQAYGENAPTRVPAPPTEAAWSAGWCIAGGVAGALLSGAAALLGGFAGGIFAIFASVALLLRLDWWLPAAAPAIGFATSFGAVAGRRFADEMRQRADLRRMFARFVDPGVAALIWRQRGELLAGGRPRPMRFQATVLVSDLAGFSAVSETMDPAAVMDWIGNYMDRMTDLVIDRGGMVEKYAGDGLLAVFGGPAAGAEADAVTQARQAIDCALAMRAAIDRMNERRDERGWPLLRARIGIHSGAVVAGAVGSMRRSQYTVVGDTPNVAARLEAFDKDNVAFGDREGNCRILASGTTLALVGSAYRAEKIADSVVRGRAGRIEIYRVIGMAESR